MEDNNGNTVHWESQTPIPSFAKRQKDPEWERKQRQREYRVAARREKRNRKADEKKQRKLNATILRRMTRNPEKYTKNADRNKLRGIELERRMIRSNAVRQAERLAAIYDPSGVMFNVGPVVTQDDGSVVAVEVLRLREQRAQEKEEKNTKPTGPKPHGASPLTSGISAGDITLPETLSANRYNLISAEIAPGLHGEEGLSKTQQKKLARMDVKPHRRQPILPNGIEVPTGEDDWISMWDLSEEELYRRILRAKKRKANERKALRLTQKSGKIERRAARDEKRRVYRDLKETWKVIKAEERRLKTSLKQIELRELKSIAVNLNVFERRRALDKCADLGFNFENTNGLNEIKPRLYGLKGKSVDLNNLEIGAGLEIRPKGGDNNFSKHSRRVDLSKGSREAVEFITAETHPQIIDNTVPGYVSDVEADLINLDVGDATHHEEASYNHRLRRKIRRALDHTQLEKEAKVRERAIEYCESNSIPIPPELRIDGKATQQPGRRVLENGTLETAKQERVRARLDLAEYNAAAKVLRRQAKEIALEAGLRVHAELTGRISTMEKPNSMLSGNYGIGWFVPQPPNPDDTLKDTDLMIKKQPGLDRHNHTDGSQGNRLDDSMDFAFELHGREF